MGYFTYYELTIDHDSKENQFKIAKALSQLEYFSYYWKDSDPDCIEDVIGYEEMKWYDHEEDILEISKQFPDITFCLHGEGEDRGDVWNKYFKNGRRAIYYASFVLKEFNPKDLK